MEQTLKWSLLLWGKVSHCLEGAAHTLMGWLSGSATDIFCWYIQILYSTNKPLCQPKTPAVYTRDSPAAAVDPHAIDCKTMSIWNDMWPYICLATNSKATATRAWYLEWEVWHLAVHFGPEKSFRTEFQTNQEPHETMTYGTFITTTLVFGCKCLRLQPQLSSYGQRKW